MNATKKMIQRLSATVSVRYAPPDNGKHGGMTEKQLERLIRSALKDLCVSVSVSAVDRGMKEEEE